MAKKNISIIVDFMTGNSSTSFKVKQFDTVDLEVCTYMNNLEFNPTGNKCKLFVGINKDVYLQDKEINVFENKISLSIDKNILSNTGLAYCELELSSADGVIASSTFIFSIVDKIGEGAVIPGNIDGFVDKYEKLISEFKSKVDATVSDCNNRVDKKLSQLQTDYNSTKNEVIKTKEDIVNKFNSLAPEQSSNAEVQLARIDITGKTHASLQDRLLADNKMQNVLFETVEG